MIPHVIELRGVDLAIIAIYFAAVLAVFVGVLLAIYGALTPASGLMEWSNPPETVLAELHAPVWWGGLMVIVGVIYAIRFRPREA